MGTLNGSEGKSSTKGQTSLSLCFIALVLFSLVCSTCVCVCVCAGGTTDGLDRIFDLDLSIGSTRTPLMMDSFFYYPSQQNNHVGTATSSRPFGEHYGQISPRVINPTFASPPSTTSQRTTDLIHPAQPAKSDLSIPSTRSIKMTLYISFD